MLQHCTQCNDGISFAKQAKAINASVSDIYRRLEGRPGRGRGDSVQTKKLESPPNAACPTINVH